MNTYLFKKTSKTTYTDNKNVPTFIMTSIEDFRCLEIPCKINAEMVSYAK